MLYIEYCQVITVYLSRSQFTKNLAISVPINVGRVIFNYTSSIVLMCILATNNT